LDSRGLRRVTGHKIEALEVQRVDQKGATMTTKPVTVVVRARLKGAAAEMRKLHDEVTGATKETAKAAGDLSHAVYLNPRDPKDFLGVDVWQSVEAFQKFASNPQIQGFFSQLFEGPPEVILFEDPGWNRW
jgi:quinol monooxygenase YgiN